MTVALARSSPNAAQSRQSAKSRAASTRALAMPPAHSLTRKPSSSRAATENVSLFAHLKRILRLGRLRLRGPRGAQDEFTLAAIAQNLRRLAKLVARPPPTSAAACAV